MPTVDELILEITGNNKDINLKLADLRKKLGGVGKTTDDVAKKSTSLLSSMKLGWVAIAGTVYSAIRAIKNVLKVMSVQEDAEVTLAAAMKTAGTYTKEAYEHNLRYAASLQKVTTFGDEMILSVQKKLTNFGVEGKLLDRLTKATLDFAAAQRLDLTTAGNLVAKSVGSSTNALTRYGVIVEGATGSTERMQMAVDNIEKIFGGSAAAAVITFSGRVEQLSNAWGDFQERIGQGIIKILDPFINILNNLFLAEADIDTVTKDLIKTSTEYEQVLIKLADASNKLTEAEKLTLIQRKLQLELKFVEMIKDINGQYDKYADGWYRREDILKNEIKVLNDSIPLYQRFIELLDKKGGYTKAEIAELYKLNRIYDAHAENLADVEDVRNDAIKDITKLITAQQELNNWTTNYNQTLNELAKWYLRTKKGSDEQKRALLSIQSLLPGLQTEVWKLIEALEKLGKQKPITIDEDSISSSLIDISARVAKFQDLMSRGNFTLEQQIGYWERILKSIKGAGYAGEEVIEILQGLNKELAKQEKLDLVGEVSAKGITSVFTSSDGKAAASNFSSFMANGFMDSMLKGLKQAPFIGAIIAAAEAFLKIITGPNIKKFFDDFIDGLQLIISDIVSGSLIFLIEVASNPLFWIKLSVAIVKGIIDGFINFFKNIGAFFKELFAGGGQGIADDIFGNTEDTLDSINKKADELAEKLERINRISAAFEQSVKLNNTSLKEQIKFYEKQLQRLIDIGAARKDILDIEIKIADLQEDLRALTIQEILDQDKLLKLQEQAGFFEGDRISFLNQLLTILKNEEKQIKDIAAAEGIAVDEMEAYWDIAIEIKDVNDEIKDIQDSQTNAILEQVDATKQLNEQQLSGLEKYLRKVLQIGGLPQFQIDPLIESGFQLPNLQAQFAALQQSIPSDLLNLQPIAPSNILPAAGGSNPLSMLEGLIGQSTTTTNNNNNFGSFIDTFNNDGGVNTDLFRELFTKFASAMGFNQ